MRSDPSFSIGALALNEIFWLLWEVSSERSRESDRDSCSAQTIPSRFRR